MIPFFNEIARKLFSKNNAERKTGGPTRSRLRRPHLESLEDRCMLAVLFVDASAAGSGNGLAWNSAFQSLQDALNLASSSTEYSEIWIADGTYTPSARATSSEARSETFALVDGVSLYGGFAGTETSKAQRQTKADGSYVYETILSGDLVGNDNFTEPATLHDNAYTVLYCYGINTSTTVEGLVITGGNAALSTVHTGTVPPQWINGGGVYVNNSTGLVLDNLVVSGNSSANSGGGIYIASGTVQVEDCVIVNNAATEMGGGIHLASGTLNVVASQFKDNFAETVGGGALSQNAGTLTVTGTNFSGNTSHYGGGFYQHAGTATITSSSFIANVAQSRYAVVGEGGGMYQRGQTQLTNVTFAENVAVWGGAISVINPDAPEAKPASLYTNITVSKNVASGQAGGIFLRSGQVTINNSIVAGNTGSGTDVDVYGESKNTLIFSGSNNLIGCNDGLPTLPSGSASLPAIEDGKNGNQVGTSISMKVPQLGAPTDFGNGVFVLPVLTTDTYVIDKGNSSLYAFSGEVYQYDARGLQYPRVSGGSIDIGAVEGTTTSRPAQNYVVQSLEDTIANDGTLTFREAFEAANSNRAVGDAAAGSFTATDTITFAPGLSGTIYLNGAPLTIHDSLTITGLGDELLAIDGQDKSQVLHVIGNVKFEISGMRLQNGYSHSNGGAVNVAAATLTMKNVTIADSHTEHYAYGGGLYIQNGGTTTLTDIIVHGCSAYYGGGVYVDNTRTNFIGASIYDNKAAEEGGGVYQLGNTTQFANATIARNTAPRGAGISIIEGTSTMTHVTMTKNIGVYVGGLMLGRSAKLSLNNSIIAENFAYHSPDAYMYRNSGTELATLSVSYSLIGNDTGLDSPTLGVGNIIGTASALADPGFASPSLYQGQLIYSLSSTSQAIDAAYKTLSVDPSRRELTTDVRGTGYRRISGSESDMGACERQQEIQGSITAASHALRLGQTLELTGGVLAGTASQIVYYWDLNANGYYAETGDAATQGVETGQKTTFLSEGASREPGEAYKVRLIIVDTVTGQMSDPIDWDVNIVADAPTYSIDGPREFEAQTVQYWTITATNAFFDPIMNWTVRWGDGSETVFLGGPRNSIEVYHYYHTSGTYQLRIETESLYQDTRNYQIATFVAYVGETGAITGFSTLPSEAATAELMQAANEDFVEIATRSAADIVETEIETTFENAKTVEVADAIENPVFAESVSDAAIAANILPISLAFAYDETVDSLRNAAVPNAAVYSSEESETETETTWEIATQARVRETDLALLQWNALKTDLDTDFFEFM